MRALGYEPCSTNRHQAWRHGAGWGAALATLPYLTLKVAWVTGSTIGMTKPELLSAPSYRLGNAVTIVMDLVVVVAAMTLIQPWGERAPARLVMMTGWLATGFLLPLAPLLLVVLASSEQRLPTADEGLYPWVWVLVYGGFLLQAALLLTAFGVYVRDRWPQWHCWSFDTHGTSSPLRAAVCAALWLAAGIGMLGWAAGLGVDASGATALRANVAVVGALALAAFAGVVACRADGRRARPAGGGPLVLLWVASSAGFAWSGWLLVTGVATGDAPPITTALFVCCLAGILTVDMAARRPTHDPAGADWKAGALVTSSARRRVPWR